MCCHGYTPCHSVYVDNSSPICSWYQGLLNTRKCRCITKILFKVVFNAKGEENYYSFLQCKCRLRYNGILKTIFTSSCFNPISRHCLETLSRFSAFLPIRDSWAFSLAKWMAVPSPIPLLAPRKKQKKGSGLIVYMIDYFRMSSTLKISGGKLRLLFLEKQRYHFDTDKSWKIMCFPLCFHNAKYRLYHVKRLKCYISRSTRNPTLWTLRINLRISYRLTRTDTFCSLWIFCLRNHYSIPLSL